MSGLLNDSSTDDGRVPRLLRQATTNPNARQPSRSPIRGSTTSRGFGHAANTNTQYRSAAPSPSTRGASPASGVNDNGNGTTNTNTNTNTGLAYAPAPHTPAFPAGTVGYPPYTAAYQRPNPGTPQYYSSGTSSSARSSPIPLSRSPTPAYGTSNARAASPGRAAMGTTGFGGQFVGQGERQGQGQGQTGGGIDLGQGTGQGSGSTGGDGQQRR